MKLTQRKALQICYELWSWLAENPDKYKREWPGWGKYGEFFSECPCCEYNNQHKYLVGKGVDCRKCLLIKHWNVPSDTNFLEEMMSLCYYSRSPFSRWEYAETPRTRKKYALIIAHAAKAELDKLPLLNKERRPNDLPS